MKSKVFQNIAAWILRRKEDRAERRRRRAMIREENERQRRLALLSYELSRSPVTVSRLKYNISVETPKISKSAAEQIGLGRKFELVVKDRERVPDGEVVRLTLHWKSPKKPRYNISFDIAEPADDIMVAFLGGNPQPLPIKQRRPRVGIIPRDTVQESEEFKKQLQELMEDTPEKRAERKKLMDLIYKDVEEQMKAQQERLAYFVPGVKLPNTK